MFPNLDGAGGQGWYLTWVVPVDDTHTILVYRLTITSWKTPLGQVMVPAQPSRRSRRAFPRIARRRASTPKPGRPSDFGSHLVSQDYASWLGPGRSSIARREHLGETDRGILMFRRKLLEQARVVAARRRSAGCDPRPEDNRRITLPGARKGYGIRGEGLPGLTGEERRDVPRLPPRRRSAEIKRGGRAGDVRARRGTAARLVEAGSAD